MTDTLSLLKHRMASERGRSMSAEARAERNTLIDQLYDVEHLTLAQVGERVGLSRERVRQLRSARERSRFDRDQAMDYDIYAAYMAALRSPFTMSHAQARGRARQLPRGYRLDAALAQYPCPSEAAIERLMRWRRQAQMVRQLRDVATRLGRTPSAVAMDQGSLEGWCRCAAEYQRVFGTIRNAQARAGLEPNPRGRRAS